MGIIILNGLALIVGLAFVVGFACYFAGGKRE